MQTISHTREKTIALPLLVTSPMLCSISADLCVYSRLTMPSIHSLLPSSSSVVRFLFFVFFLFSLFFPLVATCFFFCYFVDSCFHHRQSDLLSESERGKKNVREWKEKETWGEREREETWRERSLGVREVKVGIGVREKRKWGSTCVYLFPSSSFLPFSSLSSILSLILSLQIFLLKSSSSEVQHSIVTPNAGMKLKEEERMREKKEWEKKERKRGDFWVEVFFFCPVLVC